MDLKQNNPTRHGDVHFESQYVKDRGIWMCLEFEARLINTAGSRLHSETLTLNKETSHNNNNNNHNNNYYNNKKPKKQ